MDGYGGGCETRVNSDPNPVFHGLGGVVSVGSRRDDHICYLPAYPLYLFILFSFLGAFNCNFFHTRRQMAMDGDSNSFGAMGGKQ